MPICSRCGEKLHLKEDYCPVCGLRRGGGKGRIYIKEDHEISTNDKYIHKRPGIIESIEKHKIWNYYEVNTLTKEKLYSEKERIKKRIDEIEKKIVRTRGLNLPDYLFYEENNLEEQLFTIYSYLVLKDKEAMRYELSKYYDLEILTQEKIDMELTRLHKEIEGVENTLVYLEEHDLRNPDIMEFYIKRDKIRDQLDTIYDYLELEEMERSLQDIRDRKLEHIYGRLPDWRLRQKEAEMNKK